MSNSALTNQIAIVTGGTKGIGLSIAQRLARDGCRVVVWGRDFSKFENGEVDFEPAFTHYAEVSELASVQSAFVATVQSVGKPDILINNAGVNGPVVPVLHYDPEAWEEVLKVNLTGIFNCCRTVVPAMKEKGYGRVVNVSSIAGKEGAPGIAAYSAAKAGVIGFTKAFAKELAATGVLVNCVSPSMTETDLLKQMTSQHIASIKAKSPMERLVRVDEIAALVSWIASPDCTYTTGFTFDISGGRAVY